MSATATAPSKTHPRFTNHAEGVVFEPGRGLYWTSDDASSDSVDHADAVASIAKLNERSFGGFTDWRMPTVEELFLLADRSKCNPAIDTDFFPSCRSDWYWTATDDASEPKDEETGHSDYAWIVYFYHGDSDIYDRSDTYRVRAVRGPAR